MARLKKTYSNGRPRTSANASASLNKTRKDYSKNMRSYHGSHLEEVATKLSEQIKRKRIYG